MKKAEWATPNRMKFESLHKTFNRQVSMICTGNHVGNTVYSGYIRPYNRTECNGRTVPKGELQEYDLGWLAEKAPEIAKQWIRGQGKDESFILYVFFHRRNGARIIHGSIITDGEYNFKIAFYSRDSVKSRSIIDEARKYIAQ